MEKAGLKQVVTNVISQERINADYYLMWLDSPEIASEARPGQFVMVRCSKEYCLPRPFSIHQQDGDRLALLFQVIGKGTKWLSHCQAGDKVELFGPLGNGFSIDAASKNLLLVAGGIGVAPLRFLADEAINQGYSVTLLQGALSEKRLYPRHLLHSDINLVTATETGTRDSQGMMVTGLVPEFIKKADQVFACGPLAVYKTMAQMPELNTRPVQVSLEVRMGCGRGVCYGCTVKTVHGLKQVCRDGPIFNLHEIFWDELSF